MSVVILVIEENTRIWNRPHFSSPVNSFTDIIGPQHSC